MTKIAIAAMIFFGALQAQADQQTCRLEGGTGPITEFTLTYQVKEWTLVSKKAAFTFVTDDDSMTLKNNMVKLQTGNLRSDYQIKTAMEFDGDWATARVMLMSDDDGVAGIVNFRSDGYATVSYYRCDVYPFDP